MPFVSDIVGPQRPVTTWPVRVPFSLRRTSSIDTYQFDGGRAEVDLRGRDVWTDASGSTEVLAEEALSASLKDRVIDDVRDRAGLSLSPLRGCRVGPGFRATVNTSFPEDARLSTLRYLLLDDWAGAALVSGYALQHAAINANAELATPPAVASKMVGICAGFAPDASVVGYLRAHDVVPCVRGPLAPPLTASDVDAMHDVRTLEPNGMRRLRRIDIGASDADQTGFDAHFRDSHVDQQGRETVVHEYTVEGTVDLRTRTVANLVARAHVLPWQECPAALGSTSRVRGMALADIRDRVRREFTGVATCTHLNDTLRSLSDLDALLDLRLRGER